MSSKKTNCNHVSDNLLVNLGYKYYRCAHCGKTFYIAYLPDYTYKRGTKKFCSWSCMRAFDRGESPKVHEPQE